MNRPAAVSGSVCGSSSSRSSSNSKVLVAVVQKLLCYYYCASSINKNCTNNVEVNRRNTKKRLKLKEDD